VPSSTKSQSLASAFYVGVINVSDLRFNLDLAVYLADVIGCGNRFGMRSAASRLSKHGLSLKIRGLHKIAIGNPKFAYSGTGKAFRMSRTQRPTNLQSERAIPVIGVDRKRQFHRTGFVCCNARSSL